MDKAVATTVNEDLIPLITDPATRPEPMVQADGTPWTIDAIVEEAGDLAALPQVVMRLIDMTNSANATASDIEKVIQNDQAIAARVLALANSSYYGLPRRISSIKEAVVFLGFKAVRNLAMAVTAFNMFLGKSDALSLARRDLWRHSLNTALCTKIVCCHLAPMGGTSLPVSVDEAFAGGLLHDIGKMALDIAMPERYADAINLVHISGLRLHDIEDTALPFKHAQVGAALGVKWNLPQSLCEVLACHHTPQKAEDNPRLVAVVAVADDICEHLAKPVPLPGEEPETPQPPAISNEAVKILQLAPERIPVVISACQAELEKGLALRAFS